MMARRSKRHPRWLVLVLVLVAGWTQAQEQAPAEQVVAIVTAVEGEARIERAGAAGTERAEPGIGLSGGDVLVTGPSGRASLSVLAGVAQELRIDGDRRWAAPRGAPGLAWAPGLRSERVAAVLRDANALPSLVLPRWTRTSGLPFGLNWSREFPDAGRSRLRILGQDGRQLLELEGEGGVVIPSGALAAGRTYGWELVPEQGDTLASGRFHIIAGEDLERIRGRLRAAGEVAGGEGLDWGTLQQASVLVDEELYLHAGRILAEAIERRPGDAVLGQWMRWLERLAGSVPQ